MIEKNAKLCTLIKLLDAKSRLRIFNSETNKLFDGSVYQVYDNESFNNEYIKFLSFDEIFGTTIILNN